MKRRVYFFRFFSPQINKWKLLAALCRHKTNQRKIKEKEKEKKKEMNRFWGRTFFIAVTAIIFYITSWGVFAQQTRPYRVSDRQVVELIRTIQNDTDSFSRNFNRSNRLTPGTDDFNNYNDYLREFQKTTDNLRRHAEDRTSETSDVNDVLNSAANLDRFLSGRRYGLAATNDWTRIRNNLSRLANFYNIDYNWSQNDRYPNSVYGSNQNRLTGTYRLDVSRSDDVQSAIDRAVFDLNSNQRDRVSRQALRRLEAPEEIAIERNGREFTIASTKSPQVTLIADGRTIIEQMPNGRTMNVTATVYGDQLTINYSGDRANDFYVAFTPVRNGFSRNATDDLRVTRRIYLEGVNRQITVNSYYTRTSSVARFDVYRGRYNDNNAGNNNNYPVNNGSFVIPNGVQLIAVLRNDLDTRNSRQGDRFTMEVTAPSQYSGAIIEGQVGRVERSGRVSGRAQLELDFQTIRLTNGQTYNFEGFVQSVRGANGENVEIDNEGTVRDKSSQTSRTVGRTAVGAALGAIIGAIAGGGEGAAIGAGIGASVGAGSVILQGRDDLTLRSGSQVTITSSAPRGTSNIR
jgi:outer membrane lipoprotein SlyB